MNSYKKFWARFLEQVKPHTQTQDAAIGSTTLYFSAKSPGKDKGEQLASGARRTPTGMTCTGCRLEATPSSIPEIVAHCRVRARV